MEAARTAGAGQLHIIGRVLLPNVSTTILTEVTRKASFLVLVEAALAFIEPSETGTARGASSSPTAWASSSP